MTDIPALNAPIAQLSRMDHSPITIVPTVEADQVAFYSLIAARDATASVLGLAASIDAEIRILRDFQADEHGQQYEHLYALNFRLALHDQESQRMGITHGRFIQRTADKSPSEGDLFDQIKDIIHSAGEGYRDVFRDALLMYTKFFEGFTAAMLLLNVSSANDGKAVVVNAGVIKAALNELLSDFSGEKGAVQTFDNEAEAKKMASELGEGLFVVQKVTINGKSFYQVRIDTSMVKTLADRTPDGIAIMSNVAYQTWQSGKDSVVSKLQTSAQMSGEKFSRANSIYDNLVKLLSSLIDSMMKMMEGRLPS